MNVDSLREIIKQRCEAIGIDEGLGPFPAHRRGRSPWPPPVPPWSKCRPPDAGFPPPCPDTTPQGPARRQGSRRPHQIRPGTDRSVNRIRKAANLSTTDPVRAQDVFRGDPGRRAPKGDRPRLRRAAACACHPHRPGQPRTAMVSGKGGGAMTGMGVLGVRRPNILANLPRALGVVPGNQGQQAPLVIAHRGGGPSFSTTVKDRPVEPGTLLFPAAVGIVPRGHPIRRPPQRAGERHHRADAAAVCGEWSASG